MKKLLLSTFTFICIVQSTSLTAQNVLIIYDNSTANPQNIALSDALAFEGYSVSFSAVNESSWDNTNPSLTGFDAVIHMNGTTYETEMPVAGQLALKDFVENNNGLYVGFSWSEYQVDDLSQMQSMIDLVLFTRLSGTEPIVCEHVTVPGQESHPVLTNVSSPFSITAGGNLGPIRTFTSDPSEVLMTHGSNDAVALRHFGNGHILGFSNAGNYQDALVFSNTDIQQIIINFINHYVMSASSLSNGESIALEIYPNPAKDVITLATDANIESTTVFDISGNVIGIFSGTNYNIAHLTPGVYFLSVSTSNGLAQHKFVKQ